MLSGAGEVVFNVSLMWRMWSVRGQFVGMEFPAFCMECATGDV